MTDNIYKQPQPNVNMSPGIVQDPDDDLEMEGDPIPLTPATESTDEDGDDDEAPTTRPDDVAARSSYTMKNLHVFKDPKYDCTVPSKVANPNTMVALPNHTSKEINSYSNLPPFIEQWQLNKQSEAAGQPKPNSKPCPSDTWMEQFEAATEHMVVGGLLADALQSDGSAWRQYLEHEGKRIRVHKPRYEVPEEGRVDGATAQAVLDNRLGFGGHVTLAMVHSGFWLTLKPITPLEFLALDEKLASIKNEFGKLSIGLIFNNNRVWVVKHMVEFILDHVYDCSIKNWQDLDLSEYIKVTDLLILAGCGGYTLYPHGFDYTSPCTANNTCDHTEQAVLKIPNCIWYDQPAFTSSQVALLADRSTKHTVKDIIAYQEEFENRNNTYETDSGITVYFKIPTVKEHVTSGTRWFSDIEKMVDEAIASDGDRETKTQRMQRRVNQTVLRQQAHFFKRITFEGGIYMDSEESLTAALNSLSNRPGITEGIMKHIGEYIDSNIHALIAIPRYSCPKCHEVQEQEIEKHPYLIPLDTVNLFFTLGNQRLHIGSPNMLNPV